MRCVDLSTEDGLMIILFNTLVEWQVLESKVTRVAYRWSHWNSNHLFDSVLLAPCLACMCQQFELTVGCCCCCCFQKKWRSVLVTFVPNKIFSYPVYFVLVSISVFMALSAVFRSINSPDNSPFSFSVLPVLSLPYWSFQLYVSLWKSPSALIWSLVVDWAQNTN